MSKFETFVKVGLTSLASLAGLYAFYKISKYQRIDSSNYPRSQLLQILEDLKIEYTPYYVHYFHLLSALRSENRGKPELIASLTSQLEHKLMEQVKETHQEVLRRHHLDEALLHQWISLYIHDPAVKKEVMVFDRNNQLLFEEQKEPNFELAMPTVMNKELYLRMLAKIYAVVRYQVYQEVQRIAKNRETPLRSDDQRKSKYLTKNELKHILHNMDNRKIRESVFSYFSLPKPLGFETTARILKKASYTFLVDREFKQAERELKQAHERFMTAIIALEEFPLLEKDPLKQSEDEVPERFGPKWMEFESRERELREGEEEEEKDADPDEEFFHGKMSKSA